MKNSSGKTLLIAALLVTPSVAMSTVDMERLTYRTEWTLFSTDWGQLVDNYNGSSADDGMFGRSWCAGYHLPIKGADGFQHVVLEQTMKLDGDKVWVTQCGMDDPNGFLNLYEPDDATKTILQDRSIEQALESIKGIEQQLVFRNTHPRLKSESMTFQAGTWRWEDKENDAPMQTFDEQGRLKTFEKKSIARDDLGRISAVVQGETKIVTFRYGEDGHVAEFTTAEGYGGGLKYNEKGWMTSLENAWIKTYLFSYNDAGSLTYAQWPDKTGITLFYDPKTAKVTSFIDRNGEMEMYTLVQGTPAMRKVLIKRTKDGKKLNDKTFTYEYNAKGQPVREQVKIRDDNGEWVDVENSIFEH